MFPVRGLADTLVQDGRNRVEIRDVKKWRMYSVSIAKFVLYSSRFTAFLFASYNVGDFNPAKPRVNLQGKHLMSLFTFILTCF